jgi:uncharacterized membrane protein
VTTHGDLRHTAAPRRLVSARAQMIGFALVALVMAAATAPFAGVGFGILLGWDAAAAAYVVCVWALIWRMDAEQTTHEAAIADPRRAAADLLLLTAALVSLIAVGVVLVRATHASGASRDLRIGLGLASVVSSWGLVHTVFALRYARLYYAGGRGGVDYKQHEPPTFSDFAYLAFTIGMTFQVSDTDLKTTEIRRLALRHALLSYLFGTGILASMVNLVASLSSK